MIGREEKEAVRHAILTLHASMRDSYLFKSHAFEKLGQVVRWKFEWNQSTGDIIIFDEITGLEVENPFLGDE